MKKNLLFYLILIIIMIFIFIFSMVLITDGYNNDIVDNIKKNTDIDKIEYVNKYNDYYIVLNDIYLCLLDNEYVEITRIDLSLVHENNKNYDIVYRDDNFYYLNDYIDKDDLVFEYYDIYEYKLVDKIVLGGK